METKWGCSKIAAVAESLPIDRATALSIFPGYYTASARASLAIIVERFFRWAQEAHGIPNGLGADPS